MPGTHRRGASGFFGVTKIRVNKWTAKVNHAGQVVHVGTFDTKEEAAAAHDSIARHHLGQRYAFCNYASQMDAEKAIREASEIAVLINDGRMLLIGERYGEAKQQGAYQFIFEMLPIWDKIVAGCKKKNELKRAKPKKLAAKVAAMQSPEERAAVVAERAPWDATYNTANPVELSTATSHMVSRGLVQAVLIGKLKNRLGGHNIGLAPELLADTMKAINAAIVEHIEKYTPDWSQKVGGGETPSAPLATTFLINTIQPCLSTIGLHSAS
jgi:hypothetical protein